MKDFFAIFIYETNNINKETQLNEYTFTYYGYIPSYGDFDQDWITIRAGDYEDALNQLKTKPIYTKYTPVLESINGVDVTKNQMLQLELLNKWMNN